jgi:hypothetical protein
VFAVPGLDPLVVEAGEDGLPTRAYVSGHTFVFRNWRQTTVDVGIVDASGVSEAFPDVDWPNEVVSPTFAQGSDSAATVRAGHDLVGAAACVIGASSASLAGEVIPRIVEAACARFAAPATALLLEEHGQSSPWSEARGLALSALQAAGCAIQEASAETDCIARVLTTAIDIVTEANDAAEAAGESLQLLADALRRATNTAWEGAELVGTLRGHAGFIRAVVFSPDGDTLASGSDDTVKLWDVNAQQEIATLEVPGSHGYLAFSPDGDTLAVSSGVGVAVWDVRTREEIATLRGHVYVSAVAFSPNGRTLASGDGWDATVKLWDIPSGQEITTLEAHTFSINELAFSPDGDTLAVANYMLEPLRLWDVSSTRKVGTLLGHQDNVRAVAFSPSGDTLASASDDGTVKLWSVADQREIATLDDGRNLFDRDGAIYAVAFSPDGMTLATGLRDHSVKLWNPRTHREIATLTGPEASSFPWRSPPTERR